jgi:hypothetical protein
MDSEVAVHVGMTRLLIPCVNSTSLLAKQSQEPDIWMRKSGKVYKYVAVYVDALAIAMRIRKSSSLFLKANTSSRPKEVDLSAFILV